MDAKRCDRCGNYYSEEVGYPTVNLVGNIKKQINAIGNVCYDCDLCQNCWNDFEKWWEKK